MVLVKDQDGDSFKFSKLSIWSTHSSWPYRRSVHITIIDSDIYGPHWAKTRPASFWLFMVKTLENLSKTCRIDCQPKCIWCSLAAHKSSAKLRRVKNLYELYPQCNGCDIHWPCKKSFEKSVLVLQLLAMYWTGHYTNNCSALETSSPKCCHQRWQNIVIEIVKKLD